MGTIEETKKAKQTQQAENRRLIVKTCMPDRFGAAVQDETRYMYMYTYEASDA